ncbi:hypothetical protein C7M84_022537 [Penaeus vannamei]|uniref:CUB domain-containing protein n=1 Tax=Penaeus vannamei TaxID=6689 RepID=A0A3R7QMY3_PENVA|nr:integumentary mucin C.1-like [Penaeus vannamei]ROT84270.1 hypothetical protein C7M84_022537 [Penaeus vannamei]
MSATGLLLLGVVAAVGGANVFPEPRLDTLPCGTTTMNPGERVAIQSPNFPQNYDTDYRCQYEITCNPMESTYLEFICPSFELESSTDCLNDRLVVTYHGSREEKCGTDSPDGTITSDGWTRLTFASNAATTAPGFRCYIWCREQTTTTSTTTSTTTTSTTTTTTTPTTTTPTTTTTTPTTTTTTTPTTQLLLPHTTTTTTPTTTTTTTPTTTITTPTTTTPTTTTPTTPIC